MFTYYVSFLFLFVLKRVGCSKLVENGKGNVENPPMFRTGLGKSVELKQSSISKARPLLGDIDESLTGTAIQFCLYIGYAS